MLSAIHQLHMTTKETAERITDIEYEELITLLDERERILTMLMDSQNGLTDHQIAHIKHEIKALMSYDSIILKRMMELKQEASDELIQVTYLKKQKQAYEADGPVDSIFFDKKK